MTIALLFPGQGSQYIGMGKEFFEAFSEARDVFQEVDDILSYKLSALMFGGELEELTQTNRAQPAIMATSIAAFRVMEKQIGNIFIEKVEYVAGHSLGEYSALCASNALTLRDTTQLLKVRGEGMAEAAIKSDGAMLALLGVDYKIAKAIADEATKEGTCQIANDNGAGQIVLSGETVAIDAALKIAAESFSVKAIKLKVAGAFHSTLMASAQNSLAAALDTIQIQTPRFKLIANVKAEVVTSPNEIKDLLIEQVVSSVRFRETLNLLAVQNITAYAEVGPGKALANIVKRAIDGSSCFNISTPHDIDEFSRLIS